VLERWRERESTKRGEGNLMGVDRDEESGDQTGIRKVVSIARGRGGGRKDGGKKGWKSGWSLQPKKKNHSYWLNFFSACVFFIERDCEIHSGSKKSTCIADAGNKAKKSSKQTKVTTKTLSFSLSLSLSIWENWGCDFCCWLSIF
jgi:hypothetical protein